MSVLLTEKDLPVSLTPELAIEAAYSQELAEVIGRLQRELPCLIECDKDLAPFVFIHLRNRLKAVNLKCLYLDGRPNPDAASSGSGATAPTGLMGTMIAQLRDAVRGAVDRRVVVLPHLDLLTTSQGGLTTEAREVIPLLYENPQIVWLGFKDPSFPVPRVIENLFPHRLSILGISRTRLRHLVTQKESRKFGRQFNPWALYKYVSGVNAVRLRKLLSTLEGEDFPADPKLAIRQLRQATLTGTLEIPEVDLERDVGGYAKVKKRLRQEILDILVRRDQSTDADEVTRLEELIPRGMILWGPPGTGKTFFAKAMAASIGAAITIVSGPELKSKWVGESEENLRQIFHKARQSAPAIIVFDELDSFASARGTYTGSGVEHSMVNQLLTEMDGFHKEELVFVVGTTNLVEAIDPALMRPGRFEFHLHIPYPEDDDRREILKIYDRKMKLKLTPEAIDYAVRRTGEGYMTATGTQFSGDHLQAMCRAIARIRLRENRTDDTPATDVERGLTEYDEKRDLTTTQAATVATHEAGHFMCAVVCAHHADPERITIQSEMPWAGGYVRYNPKEFSKLGDLGHTRQELLDDMVVLVGGIEAERLLLDDVSSGAGGSDLRYATHIAHLIVEWLGFGETTGLRQFRDPKDGERMVLSGMMAEVIDKQINTLFRQCQERAAGLLAKYKDDLIALRNEVLEMKVLEQDRIEVWIRDFRARHGLPMKKRTTKKPTA
jgi:cell division protease FtsH